MKKTRCRKSRDSVPLKWPHFNEHQPNVSSTQIQSTSTFPPCAVHTCTGIGLMIGDYLYFIPNPGALHVKYAVFDLPLRYFSTGLLI
jgi:hypothetical protein